MNNKGFSDTEEDFDWLNDEDGSKLERFLAECDRDGFIIIPGNHAPPQEGYEYRIQGPLCFYRPTNLVTRKKGEWVIQEVLP